MSYFSILSSLSTSSSSSSSSFRTTFLCRQPSLDTGIDLWPSTEDRYLMNIISSFSKSALNAHSLSTTSSSSTTSVIDATAVTSSNSFSDGTSSSSSSVVRSNHQQSIFFADVISEHIGMFWLMHLRSLCALRGMKPSVLLGMMSTRLMMMMLIDISIDDVD